MRRLVAEKKNLKAAGFRVHDLKAAGFTADQLLGLGFSCGEMYDGGYTEFGRFRKEAIEQAGFSDGEMVDVAADHLRELGFSDGEMVNVWDAYHTTWITDHSM